MATQPDTAKQLIFGSGGGFSGQVIEYTLLENGRLMRTNSLTKESTSLKALSKQEAQTYFKQAAKLNLEALEFKHPGNMYYFIRLNDGEKQQEVVWGDNSHPAPAQVQGLYQKLEKAVAQ
jgi:hydroxymethylpyrimidine pyrophosphatase-like HAD family hydrolase